MHEIELIAFKKLTAELKKARAEIRSLNILLEYTRQIVNTERANLLIKKFTTSLDHDEAKRLELLQKEIRVFWPMVIQAEKDKLKKLMEGITPTKEE